MSDKQSPAPDVTPARRSGAFAWAFGACAVLPALGAAMLMFGGGSLETGTAGLGIYALVLSPVLWLGALAAGLVVRLTGRTARGNGIMLGALAGAAVGFSLCSGVLVLLGGAL